MLVSELIEELQRCKDNLVVYRDDDDRIHAITEVSFDGSDYSSVVLR